MWETPIGPTARGHDTNEFLLTQASSAMHNELSLSITISKNTNMEIGLTTIVIV